MKSVEFLNGRYPVKAVFSEQQDHDRYDGWTDPKKRIGILTDFLHTPVSNIVGAYESHSSSIRLVTREHPDGVTVLVDERYSTGDADSYDSLITDVPGVMIYLWTADCIPLYLYDPINHDCAMAHNGWRGICGGITQNALNVMREHFGTRAEDVAAAIGPCICESCYEVGEELLKPFTEHFGQQTADSFFIKTENGKLLLDIRKALLSDLHQLGVKPENIFDAGICSYENDAYASYRRDGESHPAGQTFSGIVLEEQ